MIKPRRRMQPGPVRRRIGAPAHPNAAPKDFVEGAEMAVDGEVVRLRYDSGDGTYQVAVMKRDNGETFTAVLRNSAAAPGERLAIRGTIKAHSSGELQLQSQTVARSVPSTRQGLVAFLSSGAIPGVGATMAERIVTAFGDDTMKVLDDAPQRLSEVEGIGPKRAASLEEAWREQSAVRHILIFLQSQGISPAYANRIHRVYGDRAVAIVKRNPYRLARDIHGIGFRIADRIAQEGGIKPDDLRRLQAGAEYALGEARGAGHIFVPREGLIDEATSILEADPIRVEEAIESLVLDGTFVRERIDDHDAIYRRTIYDDEVELTERVAQHIATPARMSLATPESLGRVESRLSFALAPGQRQALQHLIGAAMGVLTGGPGTGKTTIVRAIVEHAESVKAT
ncbi:MAG: exodeoxyribonuclease V alpha subunit, partial [Bradymonadia bacterium]